MSIYIGSDLGSSGTHLNLWERCEHEGLSYDVCSQRLDDFFVTSLID